MMCRIECIEQTPRVCKQENTQKNCIKCLATKNFPEGGGSLEWKRKYICRECKLIFNCAQEKDKHTYRYGNAVDILKENKNCTERFIRAIWRNQNTNNAPE